jgi:protein associated with RNAse G/E
MTLKMTNRKISFIWFMASLLFFIAAMVREDKKAVYIAVGVLCLILAGGFSKQRRKW